MPLYTGHATAGKGGEREPPSYASHYANVEVNSHHLVKKMGFQLVEMVRARLTSRTGVDACCLGVAYVVSLNV